MARTLTAYLEFPYTELHILLKKYLYRERVLAYAQPQLAVLLP